MSSGGFPDSDREVESLGNKAFRYGEVAERLNAAVLKTAERDERSVSSNLTLSAVASQMHGHGVSTLRAENGL